MMLMLMLMLMLLMHFDCSANEMKLRSNDMDSVNDGVDVDFDGVRD